IKEIVNPLSFKTGELAWPNVIPLVVERLLVENGSLPIRALVGSAVLSTKLYEIEFFNRQMV
ncbi:MAG: hypothetical protein M3142_05510, partial [Bacteroidota bacterium]|nr:hypothetical protein [Bacteroidota bacterium]